jgi:hypothetical protein
MNIQAVAGLACVTAALGGAAMAAQERRFPMPMEPIGNSNEAVFPAYEGWGESQDGASYYIVLGYRNRNRAQTIEIPIGPSNRIEPGGPDYGQPTVFEPGRQTTVFAIKVPKDFGEKKLTWTLVANGQPAVVTFYLNPAYNMAFFREDANGNDAPKLKLAADAPMMMGPSAGVMQSLTVTVGQPLPLKAWASDAPPEQRNWEAEIKAKARRPAVVDPSQIAVVDGRVIGAPRVAAPEIVPDITLVWRKVRGPGTVTLAPARVPLVTGGDGRRVVEAVTAATFSAPGEYVLRAEPVEIDDGFDGLCCFTFANVKVTVK